jgi:hypothetical protein
MTYLFYILKYSIPANSIIPGSFYDFISHSTLPFLYRSRREEEQTEGKKTDER